MKAKYLAVLLIAGVITIVIPSCKDYLKVDSLSSFDEDYIYSNKEEATRALMGAYATFGEDSYGSRFATMFMQNTDIEATAPREQGGTLERRDVWSLEYNKYKYNSEFKGRWELAFKGVDRANQVLEGLKASDLAETADYKQMIGEAYLIRAYWYYLLCNLWGDVPYFDKAVNADMELDKPRRDKNYIYTACIQDLVNCEEDMYFAGQGDIGITRMNRELAIGFIARIAMSRAGYGMTYDGTMKRADDYLDTSNDSLGVTYTSLDGEQKIARTSKDYYELAANYCKKLVRLSDRPLDADFAQVFKNECEYEAPVGGDVLFEMGFLANYSSAVAYSIGASYNSEPKGDRWDIPPYESKNGTSTIVSNLNSAFFFKFDDQDVRRDATFGMVIYRNDIATNIYGFGSHVPIGKWNKLWIDPALGASASRNTGVNWPIMRYSDVLLMLAEAENEVNGGPSSDAVEAFKRVRRRAFSADVWATKVDAYVAGKSSKEDFFNAIVDERAFELGGECLRKFDLIRWNLYGKKIVEAKQWIAYLGKMANGLEADVGYAKSIYYNLDEEHNINFFNKKYEIDPDRLKGKKEVNEWELVAGDTTMYSRENGTKAFWSLKTSNVNGERVITTNQICNFGAWAWRGYTDETGESAVPYLFTIPERIVSESKYLRNEGYCYNQ